MLTKTPKPLPAPNSDFYNYTDLLNPSEREIHQRVRTFMESKVAPIINKYWVEDSFPFELNLSASLAEETLLGRDLVEVPQRCQPVNSGPALPRERDLS